MAKTENKTNKVLKATFWFTVSNFLLKGISFITTPIFGRILSTAEFGVVNNFNAWLAILLVIGSLCLYASLIRARFDYADDLDSFIKTNLVFGSIIAGALSIILMAFGFWNDLFKLDDKCILLMCLTIVVHPAYDMLIQVEQFKYRYKVLIALSVSLAVANVLCSLLFIWLLEDNAFARILGGQLPTILVAIVIYVRFLIKGKKIKTSYLKYSVPMCIPFIFHMLSATVLNSSDKTMITSICGEDANGIYSMSYNIAFIASAIWTAMNSAFSPWMGEKLNAKCYDDLKKMAKPYTIVYVILCMGLMLFAPEALFILGGRKFLVGLDVIPPVLLGYVFVFLYSLYVNIEQFEKKTLGMSICTAIAAGANVLLNAIFIPKFGYVAAAYTTAFCYLLMLILHFFMVYRMKMHTCFDTKFVFGIALLSIGFAGLLLFSYNYLRVRVSIILLLVVFTVLFALRNKDKLKNILKRGESNQD